MLLLYSLTKIRHVYNFNVPTDNYYWFDRQNLIIETVLKNAR